MAQVSKKELDVLIASGDLSALIGKSENEYFDCKSQTYDLSKDHVKRELAKDVSSFANTAGGYILIGLETDENDDQVGGLVTGVKDLSSTYLDPNQVLAICDEWIYPRVDGLKCIWIPNGKNEKGNFVLIIPMQDEEKRPYLITKCVDPNSRISEALFGYAERIRDSSKPLRISGVHSILKSGLRFESIIESHFTLITSRIESLSDAIEKKFNFDRVQQRTNEIEETIDETVATDTPGNKPYLFLAACRTEPYLDAEFRKVTESASELQSMASTPLRDGGWKLQGLDDSLDINPESISIEGYSRKLRVFSSGIVTYASRLDEVTHLNRDVIIPVALAEVISVFATTVEQFLFIDEAPLDSQEVSIEARLGNLQDSEGSPVIALPYNLAANLAFPPRPSPSNSFNFCITSLKPFVANRAAFMILKSIYKFFGFQDDPPFTSREDGLGTVQFDSQS